MKTLEQIVDEISEHLPDGMVVSLSMERGSVWVTLEDVVGNNVRLPNDADKTLVEQLDRALSVATAHHKA